jgi:AcrR family transcriptional regulator
MEAAAPARELSGEKAQRMIDAMRTSVGLRGTTGSTFDHVAREAGVSRGLLHYYFGTKERLLVEVVRRDCDLRMERLSQTIAGGDRVDDADALLGVLVESLRDTVAETPEFFVILLELHTLARRNEEIAAEVAELHRRVRGHLAMLLAGARDDGVIRLAGEPEPISEVLFALGDGLAMRMLAEPERDYGEALAVALRAARALVLDPD